MEPIIAATLIFRDFKGEYLRLELEFQADINGHLDRTVTKWSRIAQSKNWTLQKLLDVHMIDIDSELAWNLEVNVTLTVGEERMPPLIKCAESECHPWFHSFRLFYLKVREAARSFKYSSLPSSRQGVRFDIGNDG